MKLKLQHILSGLFAIFSLFVCFYTFADDSVIAPQDFLTQVLAAIQSLGGLSWALKIAAVITVIISSMKVSFLNQLIWSKLGAFQAWVAPVLGLVAGIISLYGSGSVSLAALFAYVSAGAGAVILHELLDTAKAIPGLGATWVWVIGLIEGALGAK